MAALRFGLVGTGYWAQEAHATALAGHEDADLIGVWGRDPAKTEAAAARFGIAGYTDLDRLLAEVDAVIAVPPDVQAELAVRAAAAGRHLLLDKPLALSLDGADKVAEAVAAGGVASLVFFTLRFLPEVAAWMEETGAPGAGRRRRRLAGHGPGAGQPLRRLALAAAQGRPLGPRPPPARPDHPHARPGRAGDRRDRARRHRPPGPRPRGRRLQHPGP